MQYVADGITMGEIDRFTMEEIGISSLVLMERAALSLVMHIEKILTSEDTIIAVCGTGNNGGDGIAAARILAEKGFFAAICLIGEENKATKSCKRQIEIAKKLEIPFLNIEEWGEYTIIIDAIFGVGLKREITGEYQKAIEKINQSNSMVYAVDIPSGIHAKTGQIMNCAVKADITVTFGLNKTGLLLYPGAEYAKEVFVEPIGFPECSIRHADIKTMYYEPDDLHLLPIRQADANKGTFGKVLIIAGSEMIFGAAYLSAKAAYRMGTGLVKVVTAKENKTAIQSCIPETLLCTYEKKDLEGNLIWLEKELDWAEVIVIGPGIGLTKEAGFLLEKVLAYRTKISIDSCKKEAVPVIVDADAITLLSQMPEEKRKQLLNQTIITPHLKELSRLINIPVAQIKENLIDIAIETAQKYECILVQKDARTITTNGTAAYLNLSGNNGMATGGSGDVLTGIIAGLLAQQMDWIKAASFGVYVHGFCGDIAAKEKNVYAILASDIIEALCSFV